MSPSKLGDLTLNQLRAARKAMLSARWMLALETQDDATRSKAAHEMLAVNHAIVALENAQLSAIRDQLVANEADLVAGAKALGDALGDLGRVKSVMTATTGLLDVVSRVIPLLV